MKKCRICSSTLVQWHHNLIYGGKQSDDPLSILPLCKEHHDMANDSLFKEELDLIMFERGLDPADYPRSGLAQRRKYLYKKYAHQDSSAR